MDSILCPVCDRLHVTVSGYPISLCQHVHPYEVTAMGDPRRMFMCAVCDAVWGERRDEPPLWPH